MDKNLENSSSARRDYLLKAVSPSLFSAAMHPDLITALMIANLLSPKLWELAGKISLTFGERDSLEEKMRRLQKFTDNHFFTAGPAEFCRIWGLYEPDMTSNHEDVSSGLQTMLTIREALEKNEGQDIRKELLQYGVAPRYVYPTVDVMMAYARVQKQSKHPKGLVSCLDGCVLIASLALALGLVRIEDIIFIGSPFHYTLYLFPDGDGYMFNAKREIFARQDWINISGDIPEVSNQMFINKLLVCDRIITPFGSCVFPDGKVTIDPSWMEHMAKKVSWFLDATPGEISLALETSLRIGGQGISGAEQVGSALPSGRDGVEEALLKNAAAKESSLLLEAAMYAFRHPAVKEPQLYQDAAMKGFRSYILSGTVLNEADAREIADGIAGTESIYGESSRLAMPDEVLVFNTASVKERELLVDTLVRHAGLK
jgi:hypothetical protein